METCTDETKLNKLEFTENKYQLSKIAYYILMIMNETDPKLLNHHNYNMLYKYYTMYDDTQFIHILKAVEKTRIESISLKK